MTKNDKIMTKNFQKKISKNFQKIFQKKNKKYSATVEQIYFKIKIKLIILKNTNSIIFLINNNFINFKYTSN